MNAKAAKEFMEREGREYESLENGLSRGQFTGACKLRQSVSFESVVL